MKDHKEFLKKLSKLMRTYKCEIEATDTTIDFNFPDGFIETHKLIGS
jgi:hypothetical protein